MEPAKHPSLLSWVNSVNDVAIDNANLLKAHGKISCNFPMFAIPLK